MQREEILAHAIRVLEREGIANITLSMVAKEAHHPEKNMRKFWPDEQAMIDDALRYHTAQIEVWRRKIILDDALSPQQKILKRYEALTESVDNQRYPGCLFIAACTFYPDPSHPVHQLADQQKKAAWDHTYSLLTQMDIDDPTMVADQLELVLEGCLSRLLVKRSKTDIETARQLAEDILRLAVCRQGGALT